MTDSRSNFAIAALELAAVDAITRHSVPDLPDRMIAATGLLFGVPWFHGVRRDKLDARFARSFILMDEAGRTAAGRIHHVHAKRTKP